VLYIESAAITAAIAKKKTTSCQRSQATGHLDYTNDQTGTEDSGCVAIDKKTDFCNGGTDGTKMYLKAVVMTKAQSWTSATDSTCKAMIATVCRCYDQTQVTGTPDAADGTCKADLTVCNSLTTATLG